MRIQPARRVCGRLRLPGDKSISHRAAILAALAQGSSTIENFSSSEDCAATLRCLEQLGVTVEREGATVRINGVGMDGLSAPVGPLDCGNSGSTMRMLAGVVAGQDFVSILTGDASLRSRPMRRIIEPLAMMGAHIESTEGRAPLQIIGRRPLESISYAMPVASAQVKSCVLLAGLSAAGRTAVIEKIPTRDHTERMLSWFGVDLEMKTEGQDEGPTANILSVNGAARFSARNIAVPGDISSAAFFIIAAAALDGSSLMLTNIGLNRTRAQILPVMQSLGVGVRALNVRDECNELVGDILVKGGSRLAPVHVSEPANILRGPLIAQLIDELPALAVMGTRVEGGLRIRDAAELRVKESDRIRTTVDNLRAMGTEVKEYEDGLNVAGPMKLRGARLDAHGDHRIAMAFTVAALMAEGESEIVGADCARVSFPEFFELMNSVVER